MKRTSLLLAAALAATAVAAPVAVAHNDGPSRGGDAPGAHKGKKAKKGHKGERKVRTTTHLVHACVTADATATGVDTRVLGGNRAAHKALAGATGLNVKIDGSTTIRLTGKAARAKVKALRSEGTRVRGGHRHRSLKGTFADLTAGDRVVIKIRAKRGTGAAELPAASRIIDLGTSRRCTTEPATPRQPSVPEGFTPA